MTVHCYLITSSFDERMDLWSATAMVANWIEGRGPEGRETWQVMVYGEHSEAFLDAARKAAVTVEEVHGAGDSETYELLIGEPGTGWAKEASGG